MRPDETADGNDSLPGDAPALSPEDASAAIEELVPVPEETGEPGKEGSSADGAGAQADPETEETAPAPEGPLPPAAATPANAEELIAQDGQTVDNAGDEPARTGDVAARTVNAPDAGIHPAEVDQVDTAGAAGPDLPGTAENETGDSPEVTKPAAAANARPDTAPPTGPADSGPRTRSPDDGGEPAPAEGRIDADLDAVSRKDSAGTAARPGAGSGPSGTPSQVTSQDNPDLMAVTAGAAAPAGTPAAPAIAGSAQPAMSPANLLVVPATDIPNVLTQALSSQDDGPDRLVVQLDPPELGRVSLDFKFDAQGLQAVTITGETPEAMRRMRMMHFELVQALEQHGLSGEDLTFSQQQSGQHQHRQMQFSQANLAPHPDAQNAWIVSPPTRPSPSPEAQGLDIKV